MNNVIFARTRHHYVPYDDLYRLAKLSGYEVQYIDEIDWHDYTAIVICPVKSDEWMCIEQAHSARFIWWNLERGLDNATEMDMANPHVPFYVDEVWASDPAYARSIGAKYVFLGGHRAFGSVDVQSKKYDIITLMYWSGRRQNLRFDLRDFSNADQTGGLWGDERHEKLMQSRLMISAHQDDKPYSEPIRFTIAGCYALPRLSETCEDSGYWEKGKHYLSASLASLGDTARSVINFPAMLANVGAAAWRLVCVERDFRAQVEAAL